MTEHSKPPDVSTFGRPKVGIVGAGRTRQGLGPYLAHWFEEAGAYVSGVSGRSFGSARKAALSISEQLGHEVVPYDNAHQLAQTVDALVVACPVEGHLLGLDAALAANVPCLCEKPLVSASDANLGLQRIERFKGVEQLLVENCQWPLVLSALDDLHPDWKKQPVRSLEMRLSPAWPGRSMVEDSLSHALSLLQAVVPLGKQAHVRSVEQSNAAPDASENTVRFEVVGGLADVRISLHLECCPQQPRPAWFAVGGLRLDRRLTEDYAISFVAADGRVANVQDPLARLVYGFVSSLKATNYRERIDTLDTIALRLRLYSGILGNL